MQSDVTAPITETSQALGEGMTFEPFLPGPLLLFLLLLLSMSAWLSYRRTTRPLKFHRKLALGLLRLMAALTVLGCLSRPVWVKASTLSEKSLALLALDSSVSMNLRDAPGGLSRWDYAGKIFAEHQEKLAQLLQKFELRRLLFDASVRETQSLPGEPDPGVLHKPEGRATDLGALFTAVAGDTDGSNCAGLLLITDGRHNTPTDPVAAAQQLAQARLPLFVIGIGNEVAPPDFKDLQLRLLELPEHAFINAPLKMKIEVSSVLPEKKEVPLSIFINGKPVEQLRLQLPKGTHLERVEFQYTPTQLGVHRVVAALPELAGEINLSNNQRTAFFRCYRTKLGIWYVEGAIRKEFGVIRNALETAPNVRMQAINAFMQGTGTQGLLPEHDAAWKDQRLVILGDLSAARLDPTALKKLAQFVEEGGSLLALGGTTNWGAGQWHKTILADLLPVVMHTEAALIKGPLPLAIAKGAENDPILNLGEGTKGLKAWEQLPNLPYINAVSALKPAARVLLNAGPHPLLAIQEYGRGRTAVLLCDSTWQWLLRAGQQELHKRFWRNLMTWLTRSDFQGADQVVFVESDRFSYLLGQEVNLSARVQETSQTLGQLDRIRIQATLAREEGPAQSWELGNSIGAYELRRTPPEQGTYRFEVEVFDRSNRTLGKDALSFQVEVPDLENNDPRSNLVLLRQLAALTGGKYFSENKAAEAFDVLLNRPAGFQTTIRESRDLWNNWVTFLLFAFLLIAEWSLRKKWGLA